MSDGMGAKCSCGHTLAKHALYTSCEVDDCSCRAWSPVVALVPWHHAVVGRCICGEDVHANEPRKGVEFMELPAICHLDCAPAPPAPPRSPFLIR